jgi:hypothetical protein
MVDMHEVEPAEMMQVEGGLLWLGIVVAGAILLWSRPAY